jgi:hypothetical protein
VTHPLALLRVAARTFKRGQPLRSSGHNGEFTKDS